MNCLVMKFGGASVAKSKNFLDICKIILKRKEEFKKIIVVISAMGKTTDKLLKLAKSIVDEPSKREQDMLVSVGERISMALLSMALQKNMIKSISFTGSQSGIITCNNHTNAKIIDVRPNRIVDAFNNYDVVIVAGFQGVSMEKEITTLGRGGSDTSAVALAVALNSEMVEFYKDVEGIYDKDPKTDSMAMFYDELTYEKALEICENSFHSVLHPRAIKLAQNNNIRLVIRSFKKFNKSKKFTLIGKDSFKKVEKNVYENI